MGIYFGPDALHLVGLDTNAKTCHLKTWAGDERVHALVSYIKECKLQKSPCVGILSSEDYETYLIEKPAVSTQELRSALRWRVADLIELPLESVAIDYIELPKKRASAVDMIYMIAANQNAIAQNVAIMKAAHLKPISMDIPESALACFFSKQQDIQRPKAFISVQGNSVHLQIIKHDWLLMMRRLDIDIEQYHGETNLFCQELGLQIQRSLDYCSSTFSDTSNAIIILERSIYNEALQSHLENTLGLSVHPMHLTQIEDISDPFVLQSFAAMGGIMRRLSS